MDENKNNVVSGFVCWYNNILVMYSKQCFCYIVVFETDVALALIDLHKNCIRFKIKDIIAWALWQKINVFLFSFYLFSCLVLHDIQKNFKVIIPIYGAWFMVLGTYRKDITQRFVFDPKLTQRKEYNWPLDFKLEICVED